MACNPSENHMKLYKLGAAFQNDVNVKKMFKNPSNLVVKKMQQLFGFEPNEWKSWEPSKTDINKFKGELKYMLKWIKKGKLAGPLGRNLYTTSGIARRNPLLANLYDNLLTIQHSLKGRQIIGDQQFSKILDSLKTDGIKTGMLKTSRSFKKVNKRLQKYENQIEEILVDIEKNVPRSREKLVNKEAELNKFLIEGEGKVFKNFIDLIESKENGLRSIPKIQEITTARKGKDLSERNIKDIKDSIRNSKITDSINMENALVEYVDMMHTAYKTLSNGVNSYIDAIQSGMLTKGITDVSQLEGVRTRLLKKLLPDEKAGYYPHFRYDLNVQFLDGLMPKLQKLAVDSNIANEAGIKGAVDQVDLMKAAVDDINLYMSKRIKARTKDLDNSLYSMNFPVTVKRYLDEINRFNFVAHTQKYTREVLKDAINTFKQGKDLEGYGTQFVEMVKEMNSAQLGTKEIANPEWNNLSRAILNMEFVSKLGWNARSGVKNATQGLLNLVEFGPMHMLKMKSFYRDAKMQEAVDLAMAESGLRFDSGTPELEGFGNQKAFRHTINLAGNEITFTKPSKMSQFADATGWLAGKSGVFMRGIENFNRKTTYKLAFYKMYDSLYKNTGYRDAWQGGKKSPQTDKQWKSHVMHKSRLYSERMVTLLHFDYSSVSKSQLLRSPVGRFMFQFQHYGMKFGEYNFGLLRNAKHGLMAGEIGFSGEVGKAYRMGIAYFMVPALLSALMKTDWTRVIQHDSQSRMSQWWDFFTGDEEEFQRASFGRGAIGALIGAPVFSDALALGELAELWELDPDGWAALLAGYNNMGESTEDQKIRKLISTINVQMGRTIYTTGDMIFDGHGGQAAFFEAGLFPTAKAKQYQEFGVDIAENILPKKVLDALDLFEDHREAARSKSGASQKSKGIKR
tara:strand:+ start:15547 stop:18273 length:2727 start_codon:yes stop_codon:yes gene_type:complete